MKGDLIFLNHQIDRAWAAFEADSAYLTRFFFVDAVAMEWINPRSRQLYVLIESIEEARSVQKAINMGAALDEISQWRIGVPPSLKLAVLAMIFSIVRTDEPDSGANPLVSTELPIRRIRIRSDILAIESILVSEKTGNDAKMRQAVTWVKAIVGQIDQHVLKSDGACDFFSGKSTAKKISMDVTATSNMLSDILHLSADEKAESKFSLRFTPLMLIRKCVKAIAARSEQSDRLSEIIDSTINELNIRLYADLFIDMTNLMLSSSRHRYDYLAQLEYNDKDGIDKELITVAMDCALSTGEPSKFLIDCLSSTDESRQTTIKKVSASFKRHGNFPVSFRKAVEAIEANYTENPVSDMGQKKHPAQGVDRDSDDVFDPLDIDDSDPAMSENCEVETLSTFAIADETQIVTLSKKFQKSADSEVAATLASMTRLTNPMLTTKNANSSAEVRRILDDEFPWMSNATAQITDEMGRNERFHGGIKISDRPYVLLGDSGCGKTSYLNRLAELVRPDANRTISIGGMADNMLLKGASRGWRGARSGIVTQVIVEGNCPNPVIILDEIDKSTESRSNGSPYDVLINLLEPESSRKIMDEFLLTQVNLSLVSYFATANDLRSLPDQIRSRVKVVRVRNPTRDEMVGVFYRMWWSYWDKAGMPQHTVLPPDDRVIKRLMKEGDDLRKLDRVLVAVIRQMEAKPAMRPH